MDNLIRIAGGRHYQVEGSNEVKEGINIDGKYYVRPEDVDRVGFINNFKPIPDKVRYSINELTETTIGKRLESGFGTFRNVKTKLPAPMTIIAEELMKLKMSFHLSIREGSKQGDKIYNIWYEKLEEINIICARNISGIDTSATD